MIFAALLLAMPGAPDSTVAPDSAVAAERAFDAMAAAQGQWTAFRAFAAPDAVMFTPRPVNAQAWLKDRADPPRTRRWQAVASYISCDGRMAVNNGAWQDADGAAGYFTTVWQRQGDGRWRWVMDHGDMLATLRAAERDTSPPPRVRRASCARRHLHLAPPTIGREDSAAAATRGQGWSPDGTLYYAWNVRSDGARSVTAYLWTGKRLDLVVDDRVADDRLGADAG